MMLVWANYEHDVNMLLQFSGAFFLVLLAQTNALFPTQQAFEPRLRSLIY